MAKLLFIPIRALRYSAKKRRGVCERRVEELREQIEGGKDVMPIRVNKLRDGTYAVKDGRHRIAAHAAAGIWYVYAVVENITIHLRWIFTNLAEASAPAFLFILLFARIRDIRKNTLACARQLVPSEIEACAGMNACPPKLKAKKGSSNNFLKLNLL